MSDNQVFEPLEPEIQHSKAEHNVHGWERAGSLAGGLLLVGKGVRRGGLAGLIQIAIGGLALSRGFTGHCAAKSLLEKGRQDLDSARSQIERAGDELTRLKDSAAQATNHTTVAGNDSLTSPKL